MQHARVALIESAPGVTISRARGSYQRGIVRPSRRVSRLGHPRPASFTAPSDGHSRRATPSEPDPRTRQPGPTKDKTRGKAQVLAEGPSGGGLPGYFGRTMAMLAVWPCRKLRDPTGPISPAQNIPAAGIEPPNERCTIVMSPSGWG